MTKHITICAGIDTGKRKLDVALNGSKEQLQVDNTPEGHKVLLSWLRQHRVKHVAALDKSVILFIKPDHRFNRISKPNRLY